jgi:hypothetical protein
MPLLRSSRVSKSLAFYKHLTPDGVEGEHASAFVEWATGVQNSGTKSSQANQAWLEFTLTINKEEVGMKNLCALFLVATFLAMSACARKVDLEAEKAKVKAVVDQFEQLWETEDMELCSRIIAHDADMVNYGTDAAERFVGWEALKESIQQQFEAYDNIQFSASAQALKVHDSGKVAWFSELADFDLVAQGQPVSLKGARITGVLEKRNGNWVFVQFHASVPVAGQAAQY